MAIEIEAKMRLTDRVAVEDRLQQAGADHEARITEINTFFDTTDDRLKTGDQGLRVRIEYYEDGREIATITHKGPRAHGQLKSRSETEVQVMDARDAANLLGALGYQPVLSFEKRRSRWRLDDCVVELDELPYVGAYCEIEGPSDEAVLNVREKIGLQEAPLIRASYIAMLMSYIRENHLRTRSIRFEQPVAS